MTALPMTLTDAGRARIASAQLGNAVDLKVAGLALTDLAFAAAPTLIALPGAFRRLDVVSGLIAGPGVVHLTALDDADIAYGVRGLGLVLTDGTLFAAFSSDVRIVEKTRFTTLALALDLAFTQPGIDRLTFGDANFAMPPATTERRGVIEIATAAEAAAGTDADRAMTPRTTGGVVAGAVSALVGGAPANLDRLVELAAAIGNDPNYAATAASALAGAVAGLNAAIADAIAGLVGGAPANLDRLVELAAAIGNDPNYAASAANALAAAIATRVPTVRLVTGAGLVTGGGDLTGDRVLTVPSASGEEMIAGVAAGAAVTPAALAGFGRSLGIAGCVRLPGGYILQTGRHRAQQNGEAQVPVTFPIAFVEEVFPPMAVGYTAGFSTARDMWLQVCGEPTLSGFSIQYQRDGPDDNVIDGFNWWALGR